MIKILAVLLLVSCNSENNFDSQLKSIIRNSCEVGAKRVYIDLGPEHGRMIDLYKHIEYCKDLANDITGGK